MNVKKVLKEEFLAGKSTFDWCFLGLGVALQIIAIVYGYMSGTPDSIGLIVSGLTGTVATILCSQGKISFYFFGYIQLITYVFCFSIPNNLHGETVENGMYFITMLYGMFVWFKHYHKNEETESTELQARKLSVVMNVVVALIFVVGTFVYWQILKNVPMFGVLDSDPFVDSITSVPAYIAQVLMVLGYKENWIYWFILDVGSIVLAFRAGSPVMIAQFVFWTLNCVYGYVKWTKMEK